MTERRNGLGQPIGEALPGWVARPLPPRTPMAGRFCAVVPLDPDRHGAALWAAGRADRDGRSWTYLPAGPFDREADHRDWLAAACRREDAVPHAIIDGATGAASGVASFLRIDPAAGSIEIGSIHFAPALQRTAAATEALYLMMRRAFDELRYRRCEWKCDALNAASRAAALRLGFRFEGIFRQAVIYKGRNRDTAWFAAIDRDWPALKAAFERWLLPDNFGRDGRQRAGLAALRASGGA